MLITFFILMVTPQAPPPFFVDFRQERTLFARNEPAWVTVRVGNHSQRPLRARKLPDVLAGLTLTRDGQALEMSDRFSSNRFYDKIRSIEAGQHKDFRLNLRRYFPDMGPGGVYQIRFADGMHDVKGKKISIADVDLPEDLAAKYVLETSEGPITIQLDPDQAPNHAANFAILVAQEFYRDMIFHRVIAGFVAQTGDPLGNGLGGSGYEMQMERTPFLRHTKYAVGMARGNADDSATSQFYLVLDRQKELDKAYTVFGRVVDGFEIVDKIGVAPTTGPNGDPANKPLADIRLYRVGLAEE